MLAAGLIGIPFELGGRRFYPGGGCDCLGLVLEVLRRLRIDVPDPWSELSDIWSDRRSDARAHAGGRWKRVDGPPREGDVAVMECGTHLAPYVGGGYVVHARRGCTSHLAQARRLPEDVEWWRRVTR